MKKTVLGILILFVATNFSIAQSGADNLKSASKMLAKFNKDPFANGAMLDEAQSLLISAFEDDAVKANALSWMTRGEIYKSLAESQTNTKLLKPEYVPAEKMASLYATEAYLKANELSKSADAKTQKKVNKSLGNSLKTLEGQLNNYGVGYYQEENYADALKHFEIELVVFDLLKSMGEESRLDDETLYDEKIYFSGVTAKLGNDCVTAIPYLAKLIEAESDEAVIYQFLYECYAETGDEEKSTMILQDGRSKFPDDASLLFSEINYFLKRGELEKMINNLKSALDKEPNNVSVITTLGQVYDQLSVSAAADGNEAKSEEFYNSASEYYGNALNKNSDNFDLNYSMGALHYNRAATLTDDLNSLADDFTSAGQKKYDEIKDQMAGYFDQALPYFLKADDIDGKDRNTLIALKEILARKDDFEGSEKYKLRLEALEAQ